VSDLKEMLATIEEHEVDDHIGRHGWGIVAKKLLKWLRYFMARSCLWKRATKKWRSDAIDADELAAHYMGWWKEACEDSDRRKELLREGLDATKRADGHWSDRVRWMNWVEKVEKELEDE